VSGPRAGWSRDEDPRPPPALRPRLARGPRVGICRSGPRAARPLRRMHQLEQEELAAPPPACAVDASARGGRLRADPREQPSAQRKSAILILDAGSLTCAARVSCALQEEMAAAFLKAKGIELRDSSEDGTLPAVSDACCCGGLQHRWQG
jgi:hypothetical protein